MTSSSTSPAIERLLIVRLSAMGDVIHTLPAVTALRHAFPHATIGWVIDERWAELLCTLRCPRSGARSPERPLVDHVHTVNLKKWRSSPFSIGTLEQMAASLSEARGRRYRVAVDLQGAIRSALLAHWSRAPEIFGFAQPRENAASMWYTRQVIARGQHVVEQNLSLAEAVARKPLPLLKIEFPHDSDAEARIEKYLSSHELGDFVLMNPGAGWGAKRWPAERYTAVVSALAAAGILCVVNHGPGEEALAQSVAGAIPFSGTLAELIALTRRSRLFIGGDTGPLHLAAALQRPVVAIFGPTDPERNGPFGTASIVLRNPSSVTSHTRRSKTEPGLLEISASDVAAAAITLLSSQASPA